ncbi:uncharacterized protein NPIL_540851 [Nephila pilipes]|uniref:Uncharacterized protein n=1 Tax=Nephila pilipes TaxID=299642 RepID=A0A8X6PJ50_NEPPI|nr:uncharacterized protein NPIL_540851 [Nephila pilipes]
MERDNFIKFVFDTLVYCLNVVGLQWAPIEIAIGDGYFIYEYGDAVLQYRNANDEMYRKTIRAVPHDKLLEVTALLQYVQNGAILSFEDSLFEGIFKFCAFLVDISIYCFRYERSDLIDISVVPCVGFMYDQYLADLFRDCNHKMWNEIITTGLEIVERQKEESC